jgi:hypothetical protein
MGMKPLSEKRKLCLCPFEIEKGKINVTEIKEMNAFIESDVRDAVQNLKKDLGQKDCPYYGHHYLPDGSMPDYSEDGYLLHKEVLDLIDKWFGKELIK